MRKCHTKEERIKLCEECERSGLTQKEFSAQNNIHLHTLNRWFSKIRKDKQLPRREAIKFLSIGNIASEKNYLEIISANGITCRAYLSKENILNFFERLLECK